MCEAEDFYFIKVFYFSEIPGWEFWRPSELRKKYLSGTLEKFDFVFTYSSVEHSGLGKEKFIVSSFLVATIYSISRSVR